MRKYDDTLHQNFVCLSVWSETHTKLISEIQSILIVLLLPLTFLLFEGIIGHRCGLTALLKLFLRGCGRVSIHLSCQMLQVFRLWRGDASFVLHLLCDRRDHHGTVPADPVLHLVGCLSV